jgi:transcriptional regulator GlxA family with amidase domain
VDWAVGQILSSQGTAAVSDLCAGLGLSGRHLTRRFEEQVGTGPKLLSRIVRFQRALRMSADARAPWALIAAECGYFDQAHLVRDFREFSGRTPTLLRREGAEMAEHFASNPSLRA